MNTLPSSPGHREPRWLGWVVLTLAAIVGCLGAKPTAGGWQDASRLAMIEGLVDHYTWAIDDSIFVKPTPGHDPYPSQDPIYQIGTQDKLFIKGHFYSDKPVFALLLAAIYQLWEWCGGPTAWQRPDLFCWLMTALGSGLAYAFAVWCIYRISEVLRLTVSLRLLVTASFALATVALPYTRQVCVHTTLLGILAGISLGAVRLHEAAAAGRTPWGWLAAIGSLAGLGYTLDLGSGPPLVLGVMALTAWRCRSFKAIAVTALAALPWILLHQAINYHIGGTFRPINTVPEYSDFPGSAFPPEALTGTWKHDLGSFLVYVSGLLLGKRGFLLHNLPMLLAVPGLIALWRRRSPYRPELLVLGGWCVATWLMYAALSNNWSGMCVSIRWFVPFLAPAYLVIALVLREWPDRRRDLLVLSAWGTLMCGLAWWYGPWMGQMVPGYWPIVGLAIVSWWSLRRWAPKANTELTLIQTDSQSRQAA